MLNMVGVKLGLSVLALLAFVAQTGAIGDAPTRDEILYAMRISDEDGDGKISPKELKAVLLLDPTLEGSSDEMIPLLMSLCDADGDGLLDSEEILTINEKASEMSQEDLNKVAFNMCDTSSDGNLDSEELVQMFARMGHMGADGEMVPMLISMADQDGDGKISFGEFSAFFGSLGQ